MADELLWHYTTTDALVSILNGTSESVTLRASSAAYLNDEQELTRGWQHLLTVLDRVEHIARENPTRVLPQMPDQIEEWLGYVSQARAMLEASLNPDGPWTAHLFVACLSRARDQLSQWRGYTANHGVAIGFDPELMTGTAQPVDVHCLAPDAVPDDALVHEVLDAFPKTVSPEDWVMAKYLTQAQLLISAARFKDEAFSEEHEHRIVSLMSSISGVHFRTGAAGLIPYVNIPIPKDAIREIMAGPGGDWPLQQGAITLLKTATHLDPDVQISHSRAPFRG